MNYQMLKAKQALQLAFLLGVCFWLLYQIEHSQHGVSVLGRKGDVGWSSVDMNLVGEDEKRKEDGGVGDDELDGNFEEEFGKELERQHMVFLNNEENNSDVEVISKTDEAVGLYKHLDQGVYSKKENNDSWGNFKKQVNKGVDKDLERVQLKEPEKNKEITDDTLKQDQDIEAGSLIRENEEDKNIIESKQEIGVANNGTVVGRSEMLDGVHGFHDENGVPQDGNDPLESRDDHANILHQETFLNSSNYHSRFSEEVASQEDMLAADHGETKE
ncbi:uncharacterized protein LOC133857654 isoform X1 [Alnus glutinosa]|uniref:uncharacterized protein LOC133857654 isoform X1 n=2 Tax=Alnus glutinosa TaxID=3517 RepID=UPI002D7A0D90|nr:uncharacterized protein LOC133857654 isoform X1 [Alnus glutinosa]